MRPHLEYANSIWCPHLKRQSKQIENVQRRATKLLKECKSMSYNERLNYLQLHSLKGRRLRGDLIQTYKIFNGTVNVSFDNFFSTSNHNSTRRAEGKIFIKHCHTNIRKYCFSNRVAPYWNELPTNIKYEQNINCFKNLVDGIPKLKQLFYEFDE